MSENSIPSDIFFTDDQVLFCKISEIKIVADNELLVHCFLIHFIRFKHL